MYVDNFVLYFYQSKGWKTGCGKLPFWKEFLFFVTYGAGTDSLWSLLFVLEMEVPVFKVVLLFSSFIGDLEILLRMLSKAVKLDFFGSSFSCGTNGIEGIEGFSPMHDILGNVMGTGIFASCSGMVEMSLITRRISLVEKESNNFAKLPSFKRLSL